MALNTTQSFHVVARQDAGLIKAYQASVPENTWVTTSWWQNGIKYVRLSANGRQAVFETQLRPSAGGDEIWVADGQLGLKHLDSKIAEIEPSTKFKFDLQALRKTGYGQLLIVGLIAGAIGLAVEVSLEAGKRGFVLVIVSDFELLLAYAFSMVLKAVGLLAAFLTASFFKKD